MIKPDKTAKATGKCGWVSETTNDIWLCYFSMSGSPPDTTHTVSAECYIDYAKDGSIAGIEVIEDRTVEEDED